MSIRIMTRAQRITKDTPEGDQRSLDHGGVRFDDGQGAAAFGRVVAGMDVARTIQQQPTTGQRLSPPIAIVRARRVQP
jgi:peptidyl-prolyl cis-trans isomerase A (cyclophilin A)